MKTANRLVYLLILLILSLGAIKPLIIPGFFPMHDDTQPARVFEMAKSLSFGQFPVRWVSDLGYGYGYPLFNFYAPLPYYIGAFFAAFGFDAIISTKFMFIIGILLASFTMFFLVREIAGDQAGVAGAMLYQYAPYHAVNIYVRGAVGEYFAYGFLPLLFLGIYKIWAGSTQKGILLGSIGFAAILLSHNILGMITVMFFAFGMLIYTVLNFKHSNFEFVSNFVSRISNLSIIFILGLGLSAFFTFPALAEKGYTRVEELTRGGSEFRYHFVYLDQLWDSTWGYAGSAPGREDGMSFKIGKIHLLLGLLGSITFLWFRVRKKFKPELLHCYIVALLIFSTSVFFMLETSRIFWDLIPGFSYIQYPWRLLNFTVFSLSILASCLFLIFKKSHRIILAVLIILLSIWFNLKYFVPKEYLQVKAEDYTSELSLRYKISKISDEYLPVEFKVPINVDEVAWRGLENTNDFSVKETIKENPTFKKYQISVTRPTKIITNITFFPGWEVYLDEKPIDTENKQGRVTFDTSFGEHTVTFQFVNTPVRIIGNTLSLFSLILLVYVTWQKRTRLK